MDDETNYKLMAPKLKRTCLSARSAISGRPNLDIVPLGAKLPMVPGNKINLYTARLGQRLHQNPKIGLYKISPGEPPTSSSRLEG